MKNKFKWIGIALMTAVLIFGLTGCPEPTEEKSNKAELTKFELSGATLAEGSFPNAAAIRALKQTKAEYGNGGTNLETSDKALTITVKTSADLAKAVTLTASNKAKIAFAAVNNFSTPAATDANFGKKAGDQPGFTGDKGMIVVRVTAENKKVVNYYAFKVYVLGTNSSIGFIKFGTETANSGTSGSTFAAATAGSVELLTSAKTAVLTAGHTSNVPVGQTIEYAHTDGADPTGYTVLPAAGYTPGEWKDGDKVVIKVTAQDKVTESYYVVVVGIGNKTGIASFKIASVDATAGKGSADAAAMTVKLPVLNPWDKGYDAVIAAQNRAANTAAEALHGTAEPGIRPPADGKWAIAITGEDGASAEWGIGTRIAPPASYVTSTALELQNGDYIFVKVVSQNGKATYYYMVQFIAKAITTAFYGSPTVQGVTSLANVDALFMEGDVAVLDVSRVNVAEQIPPDYFYNTASTEGKGHTSATARVLWDDEGVSVFVNVDFLDYQNNGSTVTRKYVPGSETHECDSVEIFLNERTQKYKEGNAGSQYRIALAEDGANLVPSISGVAGNADASDEDNDIVTTTFKNSGNYSIFLKENNGGYVVVAKIPYRWIGDANSSDVFENGAIKTVGQDKGPELGLEIQLNVGGQAGGRECVLTWNGVGGQSYHNVKNYGIADFVLGAGRSRGPLVALDPVITTQPQNREFSQAQLADAEFKQYVTVVAANEGGLKSYEWYKADDAAGANGVKVTTGTGYNAAQFKPAADTALGDHFYYVVVTNTRGTDKKSTTSNTAKITVTDKVSTPADDLPGEAKVINVADLDVVKTKTQMITDGVLVAMNNETVTNVDGVIVVEGAGLGQGLQILKPNYITPEAGYDYFMKFEGRAYYKGTGIAGAFCIKSGLEWNSPGPYEGNLFSGISATIQLNKKVFNAEGAEVADTPIVTGLYASRNTWGGTEVNSYTFSIDDIVIYKVVIPECKDASCALNGKKPEEVTEAAGPYCTCFNFNCVVCDKAGPGAVGTPADPLFVDLVFEDGDKDFAVAAGGYDGISAKIASTNFSTPIDTYNYNRISVIAKFFSDEAGTTEVTGDGNFDATIFKPFVGYTADDFPQWNDPLNGVKNKRMTAINQGEKTILTTANTYTKAVTLQRLPEGLRIERNGGQNTNTIKSIKIIGLVFWHSEKPWDGALPTP